MNKKALVIIISIVLVVIFGGYRFFVSQTKGLGGIKIVSSPTASVFFNDRLVGKTPYEDKHPVGEHVLKLIPDEGATQASSWQGKVNVNSSVLTYVNRELGISELLSGGEILTLEKIPQGEAQLAVFSQPDGSTVLLDGQEKGVTPLLLKDISISEYDVSVTSPGFISRTVRTQVTSGFKLSVDFQLALAGDTAKLTDESSTASGILKEGELVKTLVLIKDTPTGFLRVRSGPSTSYKELSKVEPGKNYQMLEEKGEWYKILYEEDKEGWISGRYASKVE